MSEFQDAVLALADTPWILVVLAVLSFVDGFFSPLPSESIIIAVAALAAAGSGPPLWLVVPVAATGAFLGDQVAYTIGRAIPLERVPFLRGERGAHALETASRALARRGTVLIISARFVPIGRIAVNMTAGATAFPRKRFMVVDAIAVVLWAGYSALMGLGVGHALHEHPLIAVVVGVVGGVLLGMIVDRIIAVVHRRYFPDAPVPEPLEVEVDEATGRWHVHDERDDHEYEPGHGHDRSHDPGDAVRDDAPHRGDDAPTRPPH